MIFEMGWSARKRNFCGEASQCPADLLAAKDKGPPAHHQRPFDKQKEINMKAQTLTAERVIEVMKDCLFTDDEDTSGAVVVEGIVRTFAFHPDRLEIHKNQIREMLEALPDEFQPNTGGGWSFLNACMTKDGHHWGEHQQIEELLALGIATKQAKILMPREMWQILPGGMPYFGVVNA